MPSSFLNKQEYDTLPKCIFGGHTKWGTQIPQTHKSKYKVAGQHSVNFLNKIQKNHPPFGNFSLGL